MADPGWEKGRGSVCLEEPGEKGSVCPDLTFLLPAGWGVSLWNVDKAWR